MIADRIAPASEIDSEKWGPQRSTFRMFVRRHPLIPFFFLAFLFSWYPWLLSLIGVRTSGGINPLGPLVSAIILTGTLSGWSGIKQLFRRIFLWRVHWIWFAIVLLFPIAVCTISAMINTFAFGAPVPEISLTASWKNLLEQFIFVFLFIGLGEEPGWRGFALPHLQIKHTPLQASFILGVFWAIWHLPLFGVEFRPAQYIPFLLALFAATVLITWIYNHTRGSILLPMMFHAMVNTIGAGYFFKMFTGPDFDRLWWIYSVLWALSALIVILIPSSGILNKGLSQDDLNL
jgi:uncharacterized protein